MSIKSNRVKNGYSLLDDSERKEVLDFILDFEKSNTEKRKSLTESLKNIYLGPTSKDICPCCGKS